MTNFSHFIVKENHIIDDVCGCIKGKFQGMAAEENGKNVVDHAKWEDMENKCFLILLFVWNAIGILMC